MPRFRFSVGLALAAVIGLPTAGLAAPATDPSTTTLRSLVSAAPFDTMAGPDTDKLTAALLSGAELPSGFAPQTTAIDDLFARIPAEIAACGKAPGIPDGTVYREYARGKGTNEELLVETLSAPGHKRAKAAVGAIGKVLKKCTSFIRPTGELPMELRFKLSPYPLAPELGEKSAAVSFTMTVPTLDLDVNGRLLVAAVHGTHATVLLMSQHEPVTADLETAARAAVKKLRTLK